MLRKIRLLLAVVCFVSVTFLFLDFTGTLHRWLGWLAKIQLLPAILTLNVGMVLVLIILTLISGRIYCSVICPLGVFQDVVSRISKRRKKRPYSYSPAYSWLRYGVLAVFILAMIAGVSSLVSLLAPYSSYGRIVSNLFAPLWQWGNNWLAILSERVNSYAFYEVDVWMKSLPTFIMAVATFVILFVLAWRNGRTYCNTICPVGTALGFLSRYSLFRITINQDKCNQCGLCSYNCKASCIDSQNYKIDQSRCVVCGNCIGKCNRSAIRYQFVNPKSNTRAAKNEKVSSAQMSETRRSFFTIATLMATTSVLRAQEKGDGGLSVIIDKKEPVRMTPVLPAGALDMRNMNQHCTACQLCVSVCPNQVLRPSNRLSTFMQPEMSYERGYCRPECTKCSEMCPTGAIKPVTVADKSSVQIGHAVWIKQSCIVMNDEVACGNCARHCPASAIQMVSSDPDNKSALQIPVVNTERCIGCGACENLCPSRPFSAIYVEGHERHRII